MLKLKDSMQTNHIQIVNTHNLELNIVYYIYYMLKSSVYIYLITYSVQFILLL